MINEAPVECAASGALSDLQSIAKPVVPIQIYNRGTGQYISISKITDSAVCEGSCYQSTRASTLAAPGYCRPGDRATIAISNL